MSVVIARTEEMGRLNRCAQGWRFGRPAWTPEQANELALAIRALHIAQHAAYALTYADTQPTIAEPFGWSGWEDFSLPAGVPGSSGWRTSTKNLLRDLRGQIYHAVSNGGTNFLPEPHRTVLDRLVVEMLNHLAGVACRL